MHVMRMFVPSTLKTRVSLPSSILGLFAVADFYGRHQGSRHPDLGSFAQESREGF